ncbi:hypothetical protein JMJ56_17680 [Belnapia sp. T18]|uniref:Sulfotransferase family protein n=1 Tax=Belnapia arida TaxID=2804533 RepID=A0ABS1U5B7_9PROT|nr:hypothetical protein [Belnapia arida]MBL6079853.1 hypothetical protein [Belnapia arida]
MTVLLHIGYHKTGSTAIQEALPHIAPQLAEAGIDIPAGLSGWLGHPDLAWGFEGRDYPWQDRPYTRAEVEAHYRPLLDAAREAGRTILLSSEEFCRLDFSPEPLAALAAFLRPYAPRVIGLVRDPLSFLLSRWRHEVQMGGEARPLAQFLGDADNLLSADFERRTQLWRQAFGAGACAFHDYEAVCLPHRGSVLPGFLALIGAPQLAPLTGIPPSRERKLHPLLCDAMRGVTTSALPDEKKASLCDQLFDLGDRLPPLPLEALLDARPLPEALAAVLAHIRWAMVNRGLLPRPACG